MDIAKGKDTEKNRQKKYRLVKQIAEIEGVTEQLKAMAMQNLILYLKIA